MKAVEAAINALWADPLIPAPPQARVMTGRQRRYWIATWLASNDCDDRASMVGYLGWVFGKTTRTIYADLKHIGAGKAKKSILPPTDKTEFHQWFVEDPFNRFIFYYFDDAGQMQYTPLMWAYYALGGLLAVLQRAYAELYDIPSLTTLQNRMKPIPKAVIRGGRTGMKDRFKTQIILSHGKKYFNEQVQVDQQEPRIHVVHGNARIRPRLLRAVEVSTGFMFVHVLDHPATADDVSSFLVSILITRLTDRDDDGILGGLPDEIGVDMGGENNNHTISVPMMRLATIYRVTMGYDPIGQCFIEAGNGVAELIELAGMPGEVTSSTRRDGTDSQALPKASLMTFDEYVEHIRVKTEQYNDRPKKGNKKSRYENYTDPGHTRRELLDHEVNSLLQVPHPFLNSRRKVHAYGVEVEGGKYVWAGMNTNNLLNSTVEVRPVPGVTDRIGIWKDGSPLAIAWESSDLPADKFDEIISGRYADYRSINMLQRESLSVRLENALLPARERNIAVATMNAAASQETDERITAGADDKVVFDNDGTPMVDQNPTLTDTPVTQPDLDKPDPDSAPTKQRRPSKAATNKKRQQAVDEALNVNKPNPEQEAA